MVASDVLDAIGRGMRLRIKDDSASLVEGIPALRREPLAVPIEVALQVAGMKAVAQMPKHTVGSRVGWAECGIDGAGAAIFALLQ